MLALVDWVRARGEGESERDTARESVEPLRAALPKRDDAAVVVDSLEDELREALETLAEVNERYATLLETLQTPRARTLPLLDAAESLPSMDQVEQLGQLSAQIRRRIALAVALMRTGNAPSGSGR